MTDAMQFIEKALKEGGQAELCFRLPPMLHEALELYRIDNHCPNSFRELYGMLVQEEFFNAYQQVFEKMQEGVLPYRGYMQIEDISNFGIGSREYQRVGTGSKKVIAILVPMAFKEACDFINICLGWRQSADIVFRMLTERILIVRLKPQLDYLLKSKGFAHYR